MSSSPAPRRAASAGGHQRPGSAAAAPSSASRRPPPPPGSAKKRGASQPLANGAIQRAVSSEPSTMQRKLISKEQMYKELDEEFRECSVLSQHRQSFNIEKQVDREQRARGMCRMADRTFQSLTYNPVYKVSDKHERCVDLKRHCGRKFDQSAGFFTPVGAHLAYHPERSYEFLNMHMHGNVEFGKLPAKVPEPDRVRARLFEHGITRRKFQWLHPNGEEPCPVPKLSQEEKALAAPPQKFFVSVRHTAMEQARTTNDVDATCGSPEVVQADLKNRFCNRNKGHVMAGDCSREQRMKQGYESGKESPASCKMAPLRVKYSGVGGRGFEKYVPIGEAPRSHISFGKAPKLQPERHVRDAIDRTRVAGNSALTGNPVKAFDFTQRKLWRGISFGPGFKSNTETEEQY